MMHRLAVLALLVGCGGSDHKPTLKNEPPRGPAWQVEARRDAVVQGTGDLTGYRLPAAGVIDLAGDRIYLQGADSRVDALVLSTGKVVFESDVSGMPMGFLPGKTVVVLGSERMWLLDHDTGARLFTSDPAPLDSGGIEEMEYAAGKFRIATLRRESANLPCCGGGPLTTQETSATIDLASGKVTSKQSSYEGDRPSLRKDQPRTLLPADIQVQFSNGKQTKNDDGSTTIPQLISITVAGNPPWTYAMPAVKYMPQEPDTRP